MGASVITTSNIYMQDIKHDMVEWLRITRTTNSSQTYPTPCDSDFPEQAKMI